MQVIFVPLKFSPIDVSSKQPSKQWSSTMHILNFLHRNVAHNEWSNGSWIQMQSIKLPRRKCMATLFSYYYIILKSLHLPWVNLPLPSCSHFLSIMAVLYISSLSVHVSFWDSFSSLSSRDEAGGRIRKCTPPGLYISFFSLFLFQSFSLSSFFFFLAQLRLTFFLIYVERILQLINRRISPLYFSHSISVKQKKDLRSSKEAVDRHDQPSDYGSFC